MIKEDSKLGCYEISRGDDMSRATCGLKKSRNFEKCPENDEEITVTYTKTR